MKRLISLFALTMFLSLVVLRPYAAAHQLEDEIVDLSENGVSAAFNLFIQTLKSIPGIVDDNVDIDSENNTIWQNIGGKWLTLSFEKGENGIKLFFNGEKLATEPLTELIRTTIDP